MDLRTINNFQAVNYLLGEYDVMTDEQLMMEKEQLNEIFSKMQPNDKSDALISYLKNEIRKNLEKNVPNEKNTIKKVELMNL